MDPDLGPYIFVEIRVRAEPTVARVRKVCIAGFSSPGTKESRGLVDDLW